MNYIPKRRTKPRMMVRESTIIRSDGHLAWTRGNDCCLMGRADHVCQGKMVAHHHREDHDGGTGIKPGDDRVIPVCDGGHAEIHNKGSKTTERKHGISFDDVWRGNWKSSPHGQKHRREHPPTPAPQEGM